MRFLVDENVPKDVAELLAQDGHDVYFVPESELKSASDQALLEYSRTDNRYLLTLDKGIRDDQLVLATGVILIRVPRATQPQGVIAVVASHLPQLSEGRLRGKITILEAGRMRQRSMAVH